MLMKKKYLGLLALVLLSTLSSCRGTTQAKSYNSEMLEKVEVILDQMNQLNEKRSRNEISSETFLLNAQEQLQEFNSYVQELDTLSMTKDELARFHKCRAKYIDLMGL